MMKPAEPGRGDHLAVGSHILCRHAASRSRLFEAETGAVLVVIADVLVHQAFHMPLVEHHRMVEQIAPPGAGPAPGHAVLPATAEAGLLRLDAEALDRIEDRVIESKLRSCP